MSYQEREIIKKKEEFAEGVVKWAKENLRDFPWRKTDSPYKVFIAEILLKRTTSKAAERVYKDFLERFPDLQTLAETGTGSIEKALKPIGLYKQRSQGLKEAGEYIMNNFNGQIPDSYEDLIEIPHIGPYTAGAILSFAFGEPSPIVDSNVKRVVTRCFRDEFKTNHEVKVFLEEIIPEKDHRNFNLGLIDLGNTTCSYDEKHCSECPLKDLCTSSEIKSTKQD